MDYKQGGHSGASTDSGNYEKSSESRSELQAACQAPPNQGVAGKELVPAAALARRGRPSVLSIERAAEMRALYYSQFVSLRTLAGYFKVSRMCAWRTVNRN